VESAVGTALALTAAVLFGGGAVAQATVARRTPVEHALRLSLLVRLARSGRWLAGTAVTALGWCLQAGALALAPVTVVQPALATTPIVVLVLARWLLDERIRRREACGIVALATAIGVIAVAAPPRSSHHAGGAALALCVGGLAAAALAPLVVRRVAGRSASAVALAAGSAYALSAVATKLATDSLGGWGAASWCGVWLAVVVASGLAGAVSEMSALQVRRASVVLPIVVTVETLVPVALAPLVFGERWTSLGAGRMTALAASLAVALAGICVLAASPAAARLAPDQPERRGRLAPGDAYGVPST
jgi:drug/metabolite transporter (DMT)-like permease